MKTHLKLLICVVALFLVSIILLGCSEGLKDEMDSSQGKFLLKEAVLENGTSVEKGVVKIGDKETKIGEKVTLEPGEYNLLVTAELNEQVYKSDEQNVLVKQGELEILDRIKLSKTDTSLQSLSSNNLTVNYAENTYNNIPTLFTGTTSDMAEEVTVFIDGWKVAEVEVKNNEYSTTSIINTADQNREVKIQSFDANGDVINEIQDYIDVYEESDLGSGDEARMTWVRPPTNLDKMKSKIDDLANYGITDLYIETFFHGQTIYPSNYAGQKDYSDNYLERVIDYAHNQGLRVHAWLHTLYWWNLKYLGNIPEGHILDGNDEIYIEELDETFYLNEELVTKQEDGDIMKSDGKVFVSPFNDQVINKITNITSELADEYDLDGISLDYIRFPKTDDPYGYGYSAPNEDNYSALHDKKVNAIGQIVSNVNSNINNAIIEADVFVWYYKNGTQSNYHTAQAWKEWIGEVDWIKTMCYSYDLKEVDEEVEFSKNAQDEADSTSVIPGFAINEGHEDIQTQYNEVYSNYSEFIGYAVWSGDHIDSELP